MFYNYHAEEERDFRASTPAEWDRAEARERGAAHRDVAWICTDRDVWHKNPFYVGPPVPHPEDEEWENEDHPVCRWVVSACVTPKGEVVVVDEWDCTWVHNHVHATAEAAKRFADKVTARGEINLEYWNERYSTLAELI